ncbi:hypothetical protein [Chroococcidiopsis sp.]|uniref:hypothetical protein n=1 Tax=Chroococcidiopsis sp. TaxID=3088168 RepID=UPI003F35B4B8
MGVYKLMYQDESGVLYKYRRTAISAETAILDFVPRTRLEGTEEYEPLKAELISVEELNVTRVYQLNDLQDYQEMITLCNEKNLNVSKSVGQFCLEVSGKGNWEMGAWANCHEVLNEW